MKSINGKTKFIGLIGLPVGHSLSPAMHNAALEQMRLDWRYIAMACPQKDLKTVLKALRALNYQGLNVTIPHKQEAALLCKSLSPLAKRLGAVNTLYPNGEGEWNGTNTDVAGFLAPLKSLNLDTERATIIGSGGSSRAVIASLEELDFNQVTIISRTPNKANSLMKTFIDSNLSLRVLEINDPRIIEEIKRSKLIVNTTPLGMKSSEGEHPNTVQTPLGDELWMHLNKETILYDLIYNPIKTKWLKIGESKGCKIINGLNMLVHQGAASLKIWTKTDEIPIQVMRKAAEYNLKV